MIKDIGIKAKEASFELSVLSTSEKNNILRKTKIPKILFLF